MALDIGTLVGYVDLDTSKADRAVGTVTSMLDRAGGVWGKTLAAAGGAAGALFGASLVGAMDMEAGTDRVAAALDLNTKQAERAGKVAGNLYANAWGDSAEDVNVAVEAVMSSIDGMRKKSAGALEDMTGRALTLSTAMNVDVVRATQVAGNMMANGLAKNGKQAFDLLTKSMSKVPVQLREDILDATDEYGQFFTSLGIEGPKAMGLLAAGAAKGMYGIDKTGDAIKEFTIRATDMSASTKAAYKSIGLDSKGMTRDLLKGGDTAGAAFDKIVSKLVGMKNPIKQQAAALALFGVPLEDLSTKDIPKFLRSLQNGEQQLGKWKGANERVGKTLNDNARTNLTGFTRKLKMAFINTLGGKVLPTVTKWTAAMDQSVGPALVGVGNALGKVTDFAGDHTTVIKVLAGILVALLIPNLILTGIEATKSAAKQVMAWLTTQAAAVKTVATFVIAKATMVAGWVLMGVQALLGAAKVAAAWLIAMGPIGLVIAAVVGLVVVIVKNWDTIKRVTSKVWGWVVGKTVGAWKAIKNAVTKGVSAALGFLRSHWPLILAILTGPIGLAVLAIVKNWDKIKAGASKMLSGVKTVLGKLVTFVKGIPGKILTALGDLGSLLKDAGRAVIGGFISGLKEKWEEGKKFVSGVGGWIKDHKGPITKDRVLLVPAGRAIMDGLVVGLKSKETALRNQLKRVTDRIADIKSAARDMASTVAGNFKSDAFGGNLASFDSTLSTDTLGAKAFRDALKTAVGKGLDGSLFTQLAESGNVALAQQFAALSRADIAAREKAFADRNAAAGAAGGFTSEQVYGAKLDRQTRELQGIRKDLKLVMAAERQLHVHGRSEAEAKEIAEQTWHKLRTRG